MLTTAQPSAQTKAVLIADDSQIVRERLAAALNELPNIKVIGQAATAPEAIRVARQIAPDIVILDIHMPGGSGIDALHAIKQAATPPLVIILTNYALPVYREICRQAGADFFYDKSAEFELLVAMLEAFTKA